MRYDQLSLVFDLLPKALLETIYMVGASSLIAALLGLPIGITLYLTAKGQLKKNSAIYKSLGLVVNIGRSFPFAILIIALIPFTRFIVGTSLGTTAAIVPLSIAAAPFFARIVEQSLQEIDIHVLEAAQMMGATTSQLIKEVLLKEPLTSLLSGFTSMVINLIGYSAMAGVVGGGGLGKVAIQYGYNQFNIFLMVSTVIVLILLVEVVQRICNFQIKKIQKRRGLISND